MSSFNCFKPSTVGSIPHKPLEATSHQDQSESSDSESSEEYDISTVRDRISSIDDACSVHSRFQSLRSESPRPEPNVLVRTLKTASLSSRNKVKSKGSSISNPSPMLSCMKGHARKNEPPDIKRKLKAKRGYDLRYDAYDPTELCQQHHGSTASSGSLSCLVRSHSDSTCLAVKAGGNAPGGNPLDGDCQTFDSGSDLRSANGSNYGSIPRNTACTPLYPKPQNPLGFGYIPPNSFPQFDSFFGSAAHMPGYVGMMAPSSYGTPNMSLGDSRYQGMAFLPQPSPQLSSYSFMLPCPPQGHFTPGTDLYHPQQQQQQQRPCSIESCPLNGWSLLLFYRFCCTSLSLLLAFFLEIKGGQVSRVSNRHNNRSPFIKIVFFTYCADW